MPMWSDNKEDLGTFESLRFVESPNSANRTLEVLARHHTDFTGETAVIAHLESYSASSGEGEYLLGTLQTMESCGDTLLLLRRESLF